MNKIRVNIYINPKQKADLDKISERTGAPVAELVRRAIDAYVKTNKA